MNTLHRFSTLGSAGRTFISAVTFALVALASSPAWSGGSPWTVASVDGAAKIITGAGAAQGVVPGHPLVGGTTIATGADGKVVLARRGDSVTIFPNSRMTAPVANGDEEPGIVQILGRLLFRMESRESRDFEVRTPYLAAAIKGTTFTVEVSRGEASVTVSEGLVQVSANASGKIAYVGAGQKAEVSSVNSGNIVVAKVEQDPKQKVESGASTGEPRDGSDNGSGDSGASDRSGGSGSSGNSDSSDSSGSSDGSGSPDGSTSTDN